MPEGNSQQLSISVLSGSLLPSQYVWIYEIKYLEAKIRNRIKSDGHYDDECGTSAGLHPLIQTHHYLQAIFHEELYDRRDPIGS